MSEARVIGQPQPGYWLVRLVRGGPPVPAAIMRVQTTSDPETGEAMERSPFLAAFIAGEPADLDAVWHRRGTPIDRAEYERRLARPGNAPADRRIDPLTVALPF